MATPHILLVLVITELQNITDKYETLVDEKYKEPVDGNFEDVTDSILQRLKKPEDSGDSNSDRDLDS